MKAAVKAVPELRFSGFEGEWTIRTLRDHEISVIDGDRGKNYPNGDDFSTVGFCLFLNAKNVTSAGFAFSEVSFISAEKDDQLSKGKLRPDDVVLTTRGTVGNIAFFGPAIPYCHMRINSGMVLLRANGAKILPLFLYSAFFAPPINGEVKKTAFGSAQPQLTVKGIYALKFGAPRSLPEQRKIADFLMAVDGRIQQLSQKKALLEDNKKGVMQQLFTQALRFKDDHGNEFPDWHEIEFGSLGKFIGGGTPSKSKESYWGGTIPWISSSDLVQESVTQLRINRFITTEAISESATKLVPKGSVLIVSRVGVGKAVVAPEDLCTSQDFTSLVVASADPYFIAYFLKSSASRLLSFNQGTSIQGFTKEDISTMKMGLPRLAEQTKIANFLRALDRKIESVANQITQTQAFKKGLLQQMFV